MVFQGPQHPNEALPALDIQAEDPQHAVEQTEASQQTLYPYIQCLGTLMDRVWIFKNHMKG